MLLILAAVAISSIQNDGILHYAQNAADNWNKAQANEATALQNYLNYLDKNVGGIVEPKVGQYVEYDVSYDDIYNSTSTATKTFGKTDGWRYLGTESGTGNHLLISTGIPMILTYNSSETTNNAQWWDTTQTNANAKMAEGLKKNLPNIPYAKVSVGTTSTSNKNTMIGLFGEDTRTTVGDYFKVTGKTYSDEITVRTLTLAELNRAVNSANVGVEGYTERAETSAEGGDIPEENTAYGLFYLSDIGLSNKNNYWLASPADNMSTKSLYYVNANCSINANAEGPWDRNFGVRPVVVLPSNIQFTDLDNDTILEIKEN